MVAQMSGKCAVCGAPTKRDSSRGRQNRTCSRECLSKYSVMRGKMNRKNRPSGMRATEADDYLALLERAEDCPSYEREYWLSEARKLKHRVAPRQFSD